jgi:hypothetical protein
MSGTIAGDVEFMYFILRQLRWAANQVRPRPQKNVEKYESKLCTHAVQQRGASNHAAGGETKSI